MNTKVKDNQAPNQDQTEALSHKIVTMLVQETSNLELDMHIIHPFVRMHVVDLNNGVYKGKEKNCPIFQKIETITFYSDVKEQDENGQ